MTSTPFSVGLSDETRLSSRVLRPPGGGHTDIFGSEPEPQRLGRRPGPNTAVAPPPKAEEPAKPSNGASEASLNGSCQPSPQEAPQPGAPASSPAEAPQPPQPPQPEPARAEAPQPGPAKAELPKPEPARAEPPKRVRVPPGGFSSGLWNDSAQAAPTGQSHNRRAMEGGRQSRLLSRLLGKLRGDHHRINQNYSLTSTAHTLPASEKKLVAVLTAMDSPAPNDEEELNLPTMTPVATASTSPIVDDQFPANIDLRYGGQYLTPDQLPEFCNQLHHLVEVIRNIQSYAKVTGEYPSELERRLEREAREVAALAGEARAARDVLTRTRIQRRALQTMRTQLTAQLATLRHTEIRELENVVRVSDRKLYKSWEAVKDSVDPVAYQPLLDEIKSKQTALECLLRLVNHRRCSLPRATLAPQPLPPPLPREDHESNTAMSSVRKRYDVGRRVTHKRRKRDANREPRSVPLSGESSHHGTTVQVTVGQPTAEVTTRASVRDIMFFTAN
ncbi:unnamed protein product, partial [Iphiclides podalirius]